MEAEKSQKTSILPPSILHFTAKDIPNKYSVTKVAGKGSYGAVAVAKVKNSDLKVAIKRIDNLFADRGDAKRILRQICLLRSLNHPNLVKIIQILKPPDISSFNTLFVVTELCGKDLFNRFMSVQKNNMKEVKWICYQILLGLNYLHKCSVLHRDLKPANILVEKDLTTKICDFGLARSFLGVMPPFYASQSKRLNQQEEEKAKGEDFEQLNFNDEVDDPKLLKLINATVDVVPNEPSQQIKLNSLIPDENLPTQTKHSKLKKQPTKNHSKEAMSKAYNTAGQAHKSFTNKGISFNVVSRWYRSPEVILMQPYTSSIDLWSFGCIFAEYLMAASPSKQLKVLFAGKSCFPKSPQKVDQVIEAGTQKHYIISYDDQLNKIFDIIGTPSESEMSWIEEQNVKQYVRSFPKRQKTNLQQMLGGDPDGIDLLQKLIVFDPRKRISMKQIFEHTFFKDVRKPELEIVHSQQIIMEFEDEDLTFARLRELFVKQIQYYHSDL